MSVDEPRRKRLGCDECGTRTVHVEVGENSVKRPVWACETCGDRRPGFFTGTPFMAGVATDGGDRDE